MALGRLSMPTSCFISSSFSTTHTTARMSSDNESDDNQTDLVDVEQHTERVLGRKGLRQFLVVDRTANLRQNSRMSGIWLHGASAGESTTKVCIDTGAANIALPDRQS